MFLMTRILKEKKTPKVIFDVFLKQITKIAFCEKSLKIFFILLDETRICKLNVKN